MIKNIKLLIFFTVLVGTHFFALSLFLSNVIPLITYTDSFVYSLLLIFTGGIALYISYFSYFAYKRSKSIKMLVISLAFFIYGASYLVYTLSGPDFNFLGIFKTVFSLSQTYGLFLGSFVLLFLLMPLESIQERVYKHRLEVFLSMIAAYSMAILLVVISPEYVYGLKSVAGVFLGSTCIFLFLVFILFFHQYREVRSAFLANLSAGILLLFSGILASFFAKKDTLFWWYSEVIILVSFSLVLIGFIQAQWKKEGYLISKVEMPIYNRIGTRLLGSFLLVAVLSILLTGYFSFNTAQESIKEQLEYNLNVTVQSREASVLDFVNAMKREIVVLSGKELLIKDLKTLYNILEGKDDETQIFESLSQLNDFFNQVDILDHDGNVILSTNPMAIGQKKANDKLFQFSSSLQRGNSYVSDVHQSKNGFAVIAASTSIYDSQDKKIGYLVGSNHVSSLEAVVRGGRKENIASSNIDSRHEIYLVNRAGFLITDTSFAKGQILNRKNTTNPIIRCRFGDSVLEEYKDYRGVDVLGASACLKNGWTILAEISTDEAYSGLEIIKIKILLAGMVIIAMVFILVFALIRKITEPIKELSRAAKKISKGDFTVRAKVDESGELGVLANSFNSMTENILEVNSSLEDQYNELKKTSRKLAESKEHLEEKVRERTHELEEAKTFLKEKVRERTKELENLNNSLETEIAKQTNEIKEKLVELERFNKLAVGREIKMIELKHEIKELKKAMTKVRKRRAIARSSSKKK